MSPQLGESGPLPLGRRCPSFTLTNFAVPTAEFFHTRLWGAEGYNAGAGLPSCPHPTQLPCLEGLGPRLPVLSSHSCLELSSLNEPQA